MSPVFVWWLTIDLVTALALAAVLAGLALHALGLGRTLRRFQREVSGVAEEIAAEGERAASRTARMSSRSDRS